MPPAVTNPFAQTLVAEGVQRRTVIDAFDQVARRQLIKECLQGFPGAVGIAGVDHAVKGAESGNRLCHGLRLLLAATVEGPVAVIQAGVAPAGLGMTDQEQVLHGISLALY